MDFKLEYYSVAIRRSVYREFSTVKTLTQYVRRNKVNRYKIYYKGELVTFVGNTMITLRMVKKMLADLEDPL